MRIPTFTPIQAETIKEASHATLKAASVLLTHKVALAALAILVVAITAALIYYCFLRKNTHDQEQELKPLLHDQPPAGPPSTTTPEQKVEPQQVQSTSVKPLPPAAIAAKPLNSSTTSAPLTLNPSLTPFLTPSSTPFLTPSSSPASTPSSSPASSPPSSPLPEKRETHQKIDALVNKTTDASPEESLSSTTQPMKSPNEKAIIDDDFDFSLGWDGNQVKISTEEMKHLGKQFFQQIKKLTLNANKEAARHLISAMHDNKDISESVVKKFREQLVQGDLSFFGKDIANGSAPLTKEAITLILEEAEKMSANDNLEAAFSTFQENLQTKIESGTLVGSRTQIHQQFARFFELNKSDYDNLSLDEQKEWTNQYQQLVTRVLTNHEIRKIERNKKTIAGDYIENAILEKLGRGSPSDMRSRHKKHEGEIQVLKAILTGQGYAIERVSDIETKLEQAKLLGRIRGTGVTEEEAINYRQFILAMQEAHKRTIESLESHMEVPELPADYPHKSRLHLNGMLKKRLLKQVKNRTLGIIKTMPVDREKLDAILQWDANKIYENKYRKWLADQKIITKTIDQFKKMASFHIKWKEKLKGELIQGLNNPQEIFHDGTCHAISLRWIAHETEHHDEDDSCLSESSLYMVTAQDRVVQAHYSAYKDEFLKQIKLNPQPHVDFLDLDYNSGIRKKLGIKEVERLIDKTAADDFIKKLKEVDLKPSHGLAQIGLDGEHSIYIRFDRENKKFRVGDPNVGIASLENEQQFFAYFKDLLDWYDNAFKAITADRLIMN